MKERKSCKGCKYYRPMALGDKNCHYLHDTGELRNSPIDHCDKYAKAPRKGKAKGAVLYG